MALEPIFFESPASLRDWFAQHHDRATEVLVGFHKKHTSRPTVTWPQAVDEALCVGWIDGIRKGIDDDRYTNRFTPRKPRSNWSAVNIRRVAELKKEGRMRRLATLIEDSEQGRRIGSLIGPASARR